MAAVLYWNFMILLFLKKIIVGCIGVRGVIGKECDAENMRQNIDTAYKNYLLSHDPP